MAIDDKSLQRALQALHLYDGEIDGKIGPKTLAAERLYAGRRAPRYQVGWSDDRVRLAVEQAILSDLGYYQTAIDGITGPATQAALEKWQDHITFERPSPDPTAGVPHATVWPTQAHVAEFYGAPGAGPHVRLTSPYPLFLDWALTTRVDSFLIHAKCHDSALRAMTAILAHYGPQQIHDLGLDQFGGCLNVRKMRNGSSWSMHAYGCAVDFDADRNQLRENHTTARFARPEYAAFLDAWEAEGWLSLGRARDMDWMHVQAARL